MVLYGAILGTLDISPFVTPSVESALAKMNAEGKPNEMDGSMHSGRIRRFIQKNVARRARSWMNCFLTNRHLSFT